MFLCVNMYACPLASQLIMLTLSLGVCVCVCVCTCVHEHALCQLPSKLAVILTSSLGVGLCMCACPLSVRNLLYSVHVNMSFVS